MAPSQLPPIFNPTQQDIEQLLAAQCHLGSKNLQVHMEPYLWKTRPDGVNVINIGKTWYATQRKICGFRCVEKLTCAQITGRRSFWLPVSLRLSRIPPISV